MKKHLSLALVLRAALVLPLAAIVAAPGLPLRAAPEGSFLDYYDKLPGKHFAGFGGVNRRSLLKRKGAIVDYKNKFIQIPGSADPKHGDLYMVQMKLYPPSASEPLIAISRLVWSQDRTPGTLDFYYGYNDAGGLWTAAKTSFPFKLKKFDGTYENAYLSRKGLTVQFSLPETEFTGHEYTYNKNHKVGESAFVQSD